MLIKIGQHIEYHSDEKNATVIGTITRITDDGISRKIYLMEGEVEKTMLPFELKSAMAKIVAPTELTELDI